jgi:glycerol-1-phosphate dehydrogenase [NAD(P)+]
MQRRIENSFNSIDPSGKAGKECWSDYKLKLEAWHAHRADFESFLADWPAIKAQLNEFTTPPERLVEILRAVDSPVHFAALVPQADEEQVRFAFLNASLMRKRLTIGDVLIFLNWDREALWHDIWEKTQAL